MRVERGSSVRCGRGNENNARGARIVREVRAGQMKITREERGV